MGIICNMLLDFVREVGGSEKRVAVAAQAKHPDGFRDNHIYPEEEFQALLATACDTVGVSRDAAERGFASFAAKTPKQGFPGYFEQAASARQFLKQAPGIHIEYPTAAAHPTAKLTILKDASDELVFYYNSPNELCVLLQALAQEILSHHGESGKKYRDQVLLTRGRSPSRAH